MYEGNRYVGEKALSIEPVVTGNYYYFTLEGLTAVQMNDTVTAHLCLTKDGNPYISSEDHYSIAKYAYSQLRGSASPSALKLLCADLLQYGSAAQKYKGYRTDALVDNDMSLDELLMMSDLQTVTFQNINETVDFPGQITVNWYGKSLDLNSKVGIKYIVDLSGYTGAPEELSLHLRYNDITGTEKTATVTGITEYLPNKNLYAFTFDGLLAAELRVPVEAWICQGNTTVSTTILYSPDTYGNNKTGTLSTLCRALVAYSDSAKAYFAS